MHHCDVPRHGSQLSRDIRRNEAVVQRYGPIGVMSWK